MSSHGLPRLLAAVRNSVAGFRNAIAEEAAVREELIALVVLSPVAVWLPVPPFERLVLVLSMLFVLVVELLNTAVERTVDRISLQHHPLAGNAKDIGSAAVLTSIVMSVACWVVIGGPVALRLLRG